MWNTHYNELIKKPELKPYFYATQLKVIPESKLSLTDDLMVKVIEIDPTLYGVLRVRILSSKVRLLGRLVEPLLDDQEAFLLLGLDTRCVTLGFLVWNFEQGLDMWKENVTCAYEIGNRAVGTDYHERYRQHLIKMKKSHPDICNTFSQQLHSQEWE